MTNKVSEVKYRVTNKICLDCFIWLPYNIGKLEKVIEFDA